MATRFQNYRRVWFQDVSDVSVCQSYTHVIHTICVTPRPPAAYTAQVGSTRLVFTVFSLGYIMPGVWIISLPYNYDGHMGQFFSN